MSEQAGLAWLESHPHLDGSLLDAAEERMAAGAVKVPDPPGDRWLEDGMPAHDEITYAIKIVRHTVRALIADGRPRGQIFYWLSHEMREAERQPGETPASHMEAVVCDAMMLRALLMRSKENGNAETQGG